MLFVHMTYILVVMILLSLPLVTVNSCVKFDIISKIINIFFLLSNYENFSLIVTVIE